MTTAVILLHNELPFRYTTSIHLCEKLHLKNTLRSVFVCTFLYDSGGQAGVDVLSVDVKSSVEFMTCLLALPVQVLQQLG